MKILTELKNRSQIEQDSVKIDLKLYNLADDIERDARNHLKRVITVLPEFDIHDEKHSEKVIDNIQSFLGDTIQNLSSYELFLLHTSAFLHDCAMAPSEYEINVMKLTEGNKDFFTESYSIKHDLKSPLKYSVALKIINDNIIHLYKDFVFPSKWLFCNSTQTDFNEYLSILLIDYQNFRNGFAKELKMVKNIEEFKLINEFIRVDYIRTTHHTRIESYIKNLDIRFGNAFEQSSWGKKLAHDLAKICRAHGENPDLIDNLSNNSQYYGSSSANLQMVAIMLRLGDIVHFSFDRAPLSILSSKNFRSEYSFQEWAVKNSGANYSIENGIISYRAYCENPQTYFKLHQYIDWIEIEIQNYFKFQRKWNIEYVKNLNDKVDRTNISNDESKFLPRRGLGFSLNQKKILELLNGVGLYKDEFACLRELYQNSLDACRCMISKKKKIDIEAKGDIQFGVEENEVGKYIYCLDNGIGMNKDIIEKYLLNIGNSYYNSSDFYKEQSKWDGGFTPTSQFGIGILSCFMIGTKIEIVTKSEEGEYISCVISGIHENFYYIQPTISDKEKIINTGTLVKVYLNNKTSQQLEYSNLDKIGLLLLDGKNKSGINREISEIWQRHIYNYISNFISVIPENIEILVKLKDEQYIPIFSKPMNVLANKDILKIDLVEDEKELNDILLRYNGGDDAPTIRQIQENISTYPIKIERNGVWFTTFMNLPNENINFSFKKYNSLHFFLRNNGISIDGISIDDGKISQFEDYFTHRLINYDGHLDFAGELRPTISIDRKSIINYPKECEKSVEVISLEYIKQAIQITKEHIKNYSIVGNSQEFNLIWDYVLDRINFADILFINELSETEYGDIQNKELSNISGADISIKEFINSKKINLQNVYFDTLSLLSQKILLSKLISCDSINVANEFVELNMRKFTKNFISNNGYEFSDEKLVFRAENWNVFNKEYDLITGLFPIIPAKLFDNLGKFGVELISSKIKSIHNYSNGLLGVFSQSPILVHPKLGLYLGERGLNKRNTNIYNFDNKRSNISIFELNDRYNFRREKKAFVLMVYISPIILSQDEEKELQKYQDDADYIKGVKEGWSLLITSMDKENTVIVPGKTDREILVSKLSDDFWEEYNEFDFKFTDGTIMIKK